MVRIGIVGIGFMGMTHFEGSTRLEADESTGRRAVVGSRLEGASVTALASRDQRKLDGDWTMIQGNFGPRGTSLDLSGIKTYRDYRELLADPEIDLVDICLPPDLHESVTLEAFEAGKHVFVEKPIAVELAAAERMVAAADDAGRLLMVGQVLPFFPEFDYAARAVAGGEHGRLLAAHFRRVIAPPDWSADMADFRKLGGWGVDLHIHDNHFISLLCGVPRQVFSRGLLADGLLNHVHTQYLYDDPGLAISCVSGGIAAKGLEFAHGFELYLERATLLFHAGTLGGEWVVDRPLTLIDGSGDVTYPEPVGDTEWFSAFTAELAAAVDGVNSGEAPRVISGQLALEALKLCYAEAESVARGGPVEVA